MLDVNVPLIYTHCARSFLSVRLNHISSAWHFIMGGTILALGNPMKLLAAESLE